jgi:hypothetical protein
MLLALFDAARLATPATEELGEAVRDMAALAVGDWVLCVD